MEHLPDPVFLLDPAGNVVAASRPSAGLTPAELAGASFLHLVGKEHRHAVELALRDAVNPGVAHALDVPLLAERGGLQWIFARVAPVRDDAGVTGILVAGIDVTARRAEEERLRRSERLMTDTQGVAHLGTWEWDVTQPHAVWSPELYKIYGLDPERHVPSYQDYLTRVHPDDVERVKAMTERVFRDHLPYSHDERVFRPDGEMRWLHTWAEAVLDDSGKLERLVGVCLDITDRRKAELALEEREARLRAVFDRAPFGITTVSEEGACAEANPVVERLLGRALGSLRDHPFEGLVHVEDRAAVRRALREGGRVQARLVRADGSPVWCRLTVSKVARTPERAAFAAVMVEDVSAERAAAAATRLAEDRLERIHQLEEASEWKSHLLGLASHEIKNPLTPMKVQIHLLREGRRGPLTPDQAKAMEALQAQTERLEKLVHDVLDVARLEQGRIAMRPADVDVARVLRQVAEAFRPVADDWHVRLDVEASAEVRAQVDPDRLQQVLYNLLGNALKFTPAGGRVVVGADAGPEGPHLVVRDTGPGLSPEQQEVLFRPFSQVAGPPGREAGTGLGLFLSRRIVEAQGGKLWVESRPGEGAAFHVRLPKAWG